MLDIPDAYRRMREYIENRNYQKSVSITSDNRQIRISDVATTGTDFHIELTREDGAEFKYSLAIYLREFERFLKAKYRGNEDFADGKWLGYTHVVWGCGIDAVRISFIRAEMPDDGVWKDCIFDLLDACVEEYVQSGVNARHESDFMASLSDIDRRQTFCILRSFAAE